MESDEFASDGAADASTVSQHAAGRIIFILVDALDKNKHPRRKPRPFIRHRLCAAQIEPDAAGEIRQRQISRRRDVQQAEQQKLAAAATEHVDDGRDLVDILEGHHA